MIYSYSSLRNGLVLAWCPSLGDSGYTLRDHSAYRRNGSLVNMAGQEAFPGTPGGRALALDATDDYAQTTTVQGIPNAGAARTISAWAYPKTITNNAVKALVQCVTSSGQTFLLDLSQSAGSYFAFTDGVNGANNLTYPSAPSLNAWHHFALTMNAARGYALYVDGVVVRSGTFGSTINTGTITSVRVGNRTTFGTFDGYMDDVRIYSRALSVDEVRTLASRRGVGLSPIRSRAAIVPVVVTSQFYTRVGGTWKTATPWINVGGVWKQATPKRNVGGTWK